MQCFNKSLVLLIQQKKLPSMLTGLLVTKYLNCFLVQTQPVKMIFKCDIVLILLIFSVVSVQSIKFKDCGK